MIDYARERALEVLQCACTVVLATTGPAGVQANEFPCESVGLDLYLLLPQTSDHLFNLEQDNRVALVTGKWELKGKAYTLSPDEKLPEFHHLCASATASHTLVRVEPIQIQVRRASGWGAAETIDFTEA